MELFRAPRLPDLDWGLNGNDRTHTPDRLWPTGRLIDLQNWQQSFSGVHTDSHLQQQRSHSFSIRVGHLKEYSDLETSVINYSSSPRWSWRPFAILGLSNYKLTKQHHRSDKIAFICYISSLLKSYTCFVCYVCFVVASHGTFRSDLWTNRSFELNSFHYISISSSHY